MSVVVVYKKNKSSNKSYMNVYVNEKSADRIIPTTAITIPVIRNCFPIILWSIEKIYFDINVSLWWCPSIVSLYFKVRVYLPYGPQWYEYSIRRLKENPNIAKYVAKSIFLNRDY